MWVDRYFLNADEKIYDYLWSEHVHIYDYDNQNFNFRKMMSLDFHLKLSNIKVNI